MFGTMDELAEENAALRVRVQELEGEESARVALLGLRIKTLESQRDGAFIQGMERAKEILALAGVEHFSLGLLQEKIDEYKAESARKAGS